MRSLSLTLRVPLHTLISVCLYHYVLVCHGQHYVNIALRKTSQQSSEYYNLFEAYRAVDNSMHTFSHTNNGDREWWEVDLGRNYQIKDIRIYPISNSHSTVAYTTITVDSRVCAHVPQNDAAVVKVSCGNFMYGRRVRITQDDRGSTRSLTITEFQVLGCQEGYFGDTCNQSCLSSNCLNSECDRLSGLCIACIRHYKTPECFVCDRGKYGEDCKHDCGFCADSQDCDKINGSCLKCVPGKKLPDCKSACKNGTYGGDCTKTCGHCKDGEPCNVITGECIDGCTAGWTSKTCDQSLVSFDVVIIACAIIGGFLILAVSISVPLWLKRSKNRTVEESNQKQVQLRTSFNRRHLQAQAVLPNPLETGVDYDDMGNPYDNLDLSVLDDDAKYTQPPFSKIKTSTEKDTSN